MGLGYVVPVLFPTLVLNSDALIFWSRGALTDVFRAPVLCD